MSRLQEKFRIMSRDANRNGVVRKDAVQCVKGVNWSREPQTALEVVAAYLNVARTLNRYAKAVGRSCSTSKIYPTDGYITVIANTDAGSAPGNASVVDEYIRYSIRQKYGNGGFGPSDKAVSVQV